jgi:hypothetical protein
MEIETKYKTLLETGIYVEAIKNVYIKAISDEARTYRYEMVETAGINVLENVSRYARVITGKQPQRSYYRCTGLITCDHRCCTKSVNSYVKALKQA